MVAAVSEALGLKEQHQIVVTMSHTHAGSAMLSRDPAFRELPGGEFIAPYVDTVVEAARQVATMARDAMGPAWLTTGRGSCKLACNRDTWDANTTATAPPGAGTSVQHVVASTVPGQWVCGFGADRVQGPADDTLMVARIAKRQLGERPIPPPDHSGNTVATGVDDAETIATLFK
eukprot:COSAG04_NODE_268_length_18517_cov_9.260940_16_plen_175_part_00